MPRKESPVDRAALLVDDQGLMGGHRATPCQVGCQVIAEPDRDRDGSLSGVGFRRAGHVLSGAAVKGRYRGPSLSDVDDPSDEVGVFYPQAAQFGGAKTREDEQPHRRFVVVVGCSTRRVACSIVSIGT